MKISEPINYVAYPGLHGKTALRVDPDRMAELTIRAWNRVSELKCCEDDIFGRNKSRHIVDLRYLLYSLLRTNCGLTTSEVGAYFGRNHACVVVGHRRTCERSKFDKRLRDAFDEVVVSFAAEGMRVNTPHYKISEKQKYRTVYDDVELFVTNADIESRAK